MAKQKLTPEKLAADEHFQQWVRSSTPFLDQYWDNWVLEHPEHKPTLLKAKAIIQMMQMEQDRPPQYMQETIWEGVKTRTEGLALNLGNERFAGWKYGVAASLLIMISGLGFYYFQYIYNTVTHHTAYGETKIIHLPDSSTVTLNANSSLHYLANWEDVEVREIWLEGEAFFEVKQIPLSNDSSSSMRLPFVVHSYNMDVEVLGTSFNVKDRERYSEVILNTGKVSVTPKQEKTAAPIAMLPGDRLAFSTLEHTWRVQQINPEIPTSWRNQELIFDEMKLQDIARILEDTYGYEITIEDEAVRQYEFTGKIKSDEIELLIPMLERSFGLNIKQNGNHINFLKKQDAF